MRTYSSLHQKKALHYTLRASKAFTNIYTLAVAYKPPLFINQSKPLRRPKVRPQRKHPSRLSVDLPPIQEYPHRSQNTNKASIIPVPPAPQSASERAPGSDKERNKISSLRSREIRETSVISIFDNLTSRISVFISFRFSISDWPC